mmetsp:Transcript_28626/g.53650  ORF Transcript_28626/g.53650 Transcript_28626/m.53650 type:complete len:80 (-) Transcript_28626:114-353(-)
MRLRRRRLYVFFVHKNLAAFPSAISNAAMTQTEALSNRMDNFAMTPARQIFKVNFVPLWLFVALVDALLFRLPLKSPRR